MKTVEDDLRNRKKRRLQDQGLDASEELERRKSAVAAPQTATRKNTPYWGSNRDNSDIANKYRDLSSEDSELEEDNGNYAPVPYDEDYDDIYDEKKFVWVRKFNVK